MNNPVVVMAVYEAKENRMEDLKQLLIRHSTSLKEWGFITNYPVTILKTGNGSYIEIFEWKSEEHASRAHQDPRVGQLWGEFAAVAEFKKLADLSESQKPFSHFKRMGKITKQKNIKLVDTMIAANDYEKLLSFYTNVFGFSPRDKFDDFANFVDPETLQVLCVTNGPSVVETSSGIQVENIEGTLKELESFGGKIVRRWEYGGMKGANCTDPEKNALMIWSGNH